MVSTVEHCWLLDLDRTLSNVDIVMEAVEHVCLDIGLDYNKVAKQQLVAESKGHSFSAVTSIRSLWPDRVEEFFDRFKKINHINSIYPDAEKFIQLLKKTQSKFLVITYGDTIWQEAKLHLVGLWEEPFIICDIPEKSVLLSQYLTNGVYMLPTSSGLICSQKVTLVDDKLVAFNGMPPRSKGIYINRTNKDIHPTDNTREINSFTELLPRK